MKLLRCLTRILIAPFAFMSKYFKSLIFLLILFLLFAPQSDENSLNPPNLAKLYLTMPIFESESFEAQIQKITKNKGIKGVLLVIDSPGGAVGASIEIADRIKALDEKIPVVAYVQGSMASGSYYAGMYAREIIANRGALIGSIGVIFNGYNIEDLMQKVGIKSQNLKAGSYKEIGTITRQWSVQEKEFLDHLLQEQYEMFYQDVMKARDSKLTSKDFHTFAEGKVFSAHTALQLGLIDKVGSMQEAIEILKQISDVEEERWLKKDKFEEYINKMFDSMSAKLLSLSAPSLKASL